MTFTFRGDPVNRCQRRAFDSSKQSDPGLTDVEDGGMMANHPFNFDVESTESRQWLQVSTRSF
jgi:hypothetical protein